MEEKQIQHSSLFERWSYYFGLEENRIYHLWTIFFG